MRVGAAVAATLLAFAGGPAAPPVAAHEVDPSVMTVLDEVEPDVPGLVVQVTVSVTTQVVVENQTGDVLEVLDNAGEPFLRIGPEGVEADVGSAAWLASNQPFEGGAAPTGAGDGPRWGRVARDPAWGWFDHRLHPAAVGPLEAGEQVMWEIPFRLGSRPVVARGHLERRVILGGFASRLVAGDRPFDGVTVQLLDGRIPGVFLRNDGAEPVVVLGADGEPFARIGPAGAEVNTNSPTWLANAQARSEPLDGLIADGSAPPAWRQVGPDPTLAWLDERGRWAEDEPPADVLAAATAAVVLEWVVPLERAGERAEVSAQTIWVPVPSAPVSDGAPSDGGGNGVPLWMLALGTAATLGAVMALTRPRWPARRPSG